MDRSFGVVTALFVLCVWTALLVWYHVVRAPRCAGVPGAVTSTARSAVKERSLKRAKRVKSAAKKKEKRGHTHTHTTHTRSEAYYQWYNTRTVN